MLFLRVNLALDRRPCLIESLREGDYNSGCGIWVVVMLVSPRRRSSTGGLTACGQVCGRVRLKTLMIAERNTYADESAWACIFTVGLIRGPIDLLGETL